MIPYHTLMSTTAIKKVSGITRSFISSTKLKEQHINILVCLTMPDVNSSTVTQLHRLSGKIVDKLLH